MTNDLFNKVKVVEFCCGTQEDLDVLKKLYCPDELIIVILTTDTDKLYVNSYYGCEEVTGSTRFLIQNGMFPSFTGSITPSFKMIRTDLRTILESAAMDQVKKKSE